MTACSALLSMVAAVSCLSWASAASDAQFMLYGNNLLGASYYYQLQLTKNGTVILELRDGDVLASRAILDDTVKKVKELAPRSGSWTDLTQFDGNLVNETGGVIGRTNCQLKSWTCEEDQAMVMNFASDAEVVDRTYKGNFNPRFQITKDLGPPPNTYGFELLVKDSSLLDTSFMFLTQYPTVAEAKASIESIQSGKYTWKTVSVRVGVVGRKDVDVLADSAGKTLAQLKPQYVGRLTPAETKAYVEKFAPLAHVDEPTSLTLV